MDPAVLEVGDNGAYARATLASASGPAASKVGTGGMKLPLKERPSLGGRGQALMQPLAALARQPRPLRRNFAFEEPAR
jgi:hypothetical protein